MAKLGLGLAKEDVACLGEEQGKLLSSSRGAVNNRYSGKKAESKVAKMIKIQNHVIESYKGRLLKLLTGALGVHPDDDFRQTGAPTKMADELPKWRKTWESRKKD